MKWRVLLVVTALFLPAAWLSADTVWISSGGGNPVAFSEVEVLRVQNGSIVFRTATGAEVSRPLEHVTRLSIDNEPALNAAEEAYASGDWAAAARQYQRAAQATRRDWLRDWSRLRLLRSADRSGQFGVAVPAFVDVVQANPAAALQNRPDPRQASQGDLESAARVLTQATDRAGLSDEQRQALLALLLDVHRARGDVASAARAGGQLLDLVNRPGDSGQAGQALAELRLSLARLALDQGQYDRVIEQVEAIRPILTEPRQQATALFYFAEAHDGMASAAPSPRGFADAAVHYMTVVAHFADQPGIPEVSKALLRVAVIHETHLDEPETALQLYRQIAAQYNDTSAAAEAREGIARLRPGT